MKTWWVSGEWNAICDQCGRKFKNTQLRKRWDGYMVCAEDFETRHPQEFIRTVKDNHPLPWTRPNNDLDSNGDPRVSSGIAFNCTAATPVAVDSVIQQRTIIGKGYSRGPVLIEDGAEVIVICEWIIEA
jgi:hypothetical protein